VTAASSTRDLERFSIRRKFTRLKLQICEVGRRLWHRAYVDGNGGNIAVRVGEGLALCTPTLVSKGFMKPEDLCLVDLEGKQLVGAKKRTSENSDALANHEIPASRGGHRPLSSAARDCICGGRCGTAPRA